MTVKPEPYAFSIIICKPCNIAMISTEFLEESDFCKAKLKCISNILLLVKSTLPHKT